MHIRRATLADTAEIATIASQAMQDDEFFSWLCPYRQEYPVSYRLSFLSRSKRRLWSGLVMLVMVTDEHDAEWGGAEKVIGHLVLKSHKDLGPPFFSWDGLNLKLLWLEDQFSQYLGLDKSVSYPNLNQLKNVMDGGPLTAYEEYWEVNHLSVDPSFQRRGIGQRLVKAAQFIAAEDKLPLVLVASKKGRGLYEKTGFETVGTFYCGPVIIGPTMVWKPA